MVDVGDEASWHTGCINLLGLCVCGLFIFLDRVTLIDLEKHDFFYERSS